MATRKRSCNASVRLGATELCVTLQSDNAIAIYHVLRQFTRVVRRERRQALYDGRDVDRRSDCEDISLDKDINSGDDSQLGYNDVADTIDEGGRSKRRKTDNVAWKEDTAGYNVPFVGTAVHNKHDCGQVQPGHWPTGLLQTYLHASPQAIELVGLHDVVPPHGRIYKTLLNKKQAPLAQRVFAAYLQALAELVTAVIPAAVIKGVVEQVSDAETVQRDEQHAKYTFVSTLLKVRLPQMWTPLRDAAKNTASSDASSTAIAIVNLLAKLMQTNVETARYVVRGVQQHVPESTWREMLRGGAKKADGGDENSLDNKLSSPTLQAQIVVMELLMSGLTTADGVVLTCLASQSARDRKQPAGLLVLWLQTGLNASCSNVSHDAYIDRATRLLALVHSHCLLRPTLLSRKAMLDLVAARDVVQHLLRLSAQAPSLKDETMRLDAENKSCKCSSTASLGMASRQIVMTLLSDSDVSPWRRTLQLDGPREHVMSLMAKSYCALLNDDISLPMETWLLQCCQQRGLSLLLAVLRTITFPDPKHVLQLAARLSFVRKLMLQGHVMLKDSSEDETAAKETPRNVLCPSSMSRHQLLKLLNQSNLIIAHQAAKLLLALLQPYRHVAKTGVADPLRSFVPSCEQLQATIAARLQQRGAAPVLVVLYDALSITALLSDEYVSDLSRLLPRRAIDLLRMPLFLRNKLIWTIYDLVRRKKAHAGIVASFPLVMHCLFRSKTAKLATVARSCAAEILAGDEMSGVEAKLWVDGLTNDILDEFCWELRHIAQGGQHVVFLRLRAMTDSTWLRSGSPQLISTFMVHLMERLDSLSITLSRLSIHVIARCMLCHPTPIQIANSLRRVWCNDFDLNGNADIMLLRRHVLDYACCLQASCNKTLTKAFVEVAKLLFPPDSTLGALVFRGSITPALNGNTVATCIATVDDATFLYRVVEHAGVARAVSATVATRLSACFRPFAYKSRMYVDMLEDIKHFVACAPDTNLDSRALNSTRPYPTNSDASTVSTFASTQAALELFVFGCLAVCESRVREAFKAIQRGSHAGFLARSALVEVFESRQVPVFIDDTLTRAFDCWQTATIADDFFESLDLFLGRVGQRLSLQLKSLLIPSDQIISRCRLVASSDARDRASERLDDTSLGLALTMLTNDWANHSRASFDSVFNRLRSKRSRAMKRGDLSRIRPLVMLDHPNAVELYAEIIENILDESTVDAVDIVFEAPTAVLKKCSPDAVTSFAESIVGVQHPSRVDDAIVALMRFCNAHKGQLGAALLQQCLRLVIDPASFDKVGREILDGFQAVSADIEIDDDFVLVLVSRMATMLTSFSKQDVSIRTGDDVAISILALLCEKIRTSSVRDHAAALAIPLLSHWMQRAKQDGNAKIGMNIARIFQSLLPVASDMSGTFDIGVLNKFHRAGMGHIDQIIRSHVFYASQSGKLRVYPRKSVIWQADGGHTQESNLLDDVTGLLSLRRIYCTVEDFPVDDDFQKITRCVTTSLLDGGKNAFDERYSPAFVLEAVLSVLSHSYQPGCEELPPGIVACCQRLCEKGFMALALAALCCDSSVARLTAVACLEILHRAVGSTEARERASWKERPQLAMLLDSVQSMIVLQAIRLQSGKNMDMSLDDGVTIPRIASPAAIFLAKASLVLARPSDPLYGAINRYFLKCEADAGAFPDVSRFPAFMALFCSSASSNDEDGGIAVAAAERRWAIELARDVVVDEESYGMLATCHAPELLMSAFTQQHSSAGDARENESVKSLLLTTFRRFLTHGGTRAQKHLFERLGLLSWIGTVLCDFEGVYSLLPTTTLRVDFLDFVTICLRHGNNVLAGRDYAITTMGFCDCALRLVLDFKESTISAPMLDSAGHVLLAVSDTDAAADACPDLVLRLWQEISDSTSALRLDRVTIAGAMCKVCFPESGMQHNGTAGTALIEALLDEFGALSLFDYTNQDFVQQVLQATMRSLEYGAKLGLVMDPSESLARRLFRARPICSREWGTRELYYCVLSLFIASSTHEQDNCEWSHAVQTLVETDEKRRRQEEQT